MKSEIRPPRDGAAHDVKRGHAGYKRTRARTLHTTRVVSPFAVAFICLSLSRHPPAASRSGRLPTLKGPGALLSLALRTWMLRCLHWNKNWWRVAGRFQLPRPLLDTSSTTEAQRAQVAPGVAATAHQATGSARKPPNPPQMPPPPQRPRSRCK